MMKYSGALDLAQTPQNTHFSHKKLHFLFPVSLFSYSAPSTHPSAPLCWFTSPPDPLLCWQQ